ncbi:NUDIX domain-containing protein [Sulfitobacter guttiformis]|uniref:8-oxo-dGTP diphosphatase n=1 Tax=Sulfitobacter guttiformis TaxID=74349 RepID=A0A420DRU7_9RHOB|nr:NUDIX domain-containing protein [Sulfitobacter guttiformis]KIN74408.1 Nudix hydrolase [Sulfitobacter guttiformis KCTC 32187]RKE97006.1 8-oxo-dGTP diphosphatase [Sulfitobacter guttiformis]
MIRRVGEVPQRGQTYKMRAGAYAILPIGRRFLLTASMRDPLDIQLPGGGIDAGESPLRALFREVREETGWSIAQPLRLGAFRRFVFMPEYNLWAEKLCHVYVAHPARQLHMPTEPDHETLILDADDAIAALGNDGDRMFMEAYATGRP